jgi:hypothetical protein
MISTTTDLAAITETESKFLNELVKDCITFRLSTDESLEYIERRFKKISASTYKLRKANILSDESDQLWLDYYTRVGFVRHHKEQIESIQVIQNFSLRQFYVETQKEDSERDETKIRDLMNDIRENVKLLSQPGIETPFASSIKSKVDRANKIIATYQRR